MSYCRNLAVASRRRIAVFPQFVAMIVIACLLTGCLTWTPVSLPASNGVHQLPLPEKLLVVSGHSDTTILRRPRIEGDAIVGNQSRSPNKQKSIPLVEIRKMRKRTVSPGRTIAAILAAALVGGIVYEASRPPCRDCISLF